MFDSGPTAAALAALTELGCPAARDVVRPAVRRALGLPIGPALAAAADALTGMSESLSAVELREVVVAWRRLDAHAAAGELTAVAALDRTLAQHSDGEPPAGSGRRAALRKQAAGEVSVALGLAQRTAARVVALSRSADNFPAALDAMAEGRFSRPVLEVLVAACRGLSPRHQQTVEALAVRLAARGRTRLQIKADVESLAAELDPAAAAARARAGRAERDVRLAPSPLAGCVRLIADLPLLHGHAAWHGIDAFARAARTAGRRADGTPEDRTIGQLRADALVGAVTGLTGAGAGSTPQDTGSTPQDTGGGVPTPDAFARLVHLHVVTPASDPPSEGDSGTPPPPSAPPPAPPSAPPPPPPASWGWPDAPAPVPVPDDLLQRAEVDVVVAAETLTGASDHPAHVPSGGPVDADTVRQVARSASYRWLVVDASSGHLLHRESTRRPPPPPGSGSGSGSGSGWDGTSPPAPPPSPAQPTATLQVPGYRPTAALRAHVLARDGTCTGPTCHHGVRAVDLDHTTAFDTVSPDGRRGRTEARNLASPRTAAPSTCSRPTPGGRAPRPSPGRSAGPPRSASSSIARLDRCCPGGTGSRGGSPVGWRLRGDTGRPRHGPTRPDPTLNRPRPRPRPRPRLRGGTGNSTAECCPPQRLAGVSLHEAATCGVVGAQAQASRTRSKCSTTGNGS